MVVGQFYKVVASFRALFAEFAEATRAVPFAYWRNVYDEQATWPVTNALRVAESRASAGLCFKVTRRSCIERSNTYGRSFIVRFYRRRNGPGLSLESVIICAKNLYSFVVVGETIRGTFASRLLIRTCIIIIQLLFLSTRSNDHRGYRCAVISWATYNRAIIRWRRGIFNNEEPHPP